MPAVTVNVAEVCEPCRNWSRSTGTLAAMRLELESVTVAPPVPAAAVRLTVPVPVWPLTIVLGLTETLLKRSSRCWRIYSDTESLAHARVGGGQSCRSRRCHVPVAHGKRGRSGPCRNGHARRERWPPCCWNWKAITDHSAGPGCCSQD